VQTGGPAGDAGRVDPDRAGQALTWHPHRSQPSAPSGPRARVQANIAALRVLAELRAGDQPATKAQQQVLSGWSSWGAVPKVFDETDPTWATARTELRGLLTEAQWSAASRTTINAHYTDPVIVSAMWANLVALGFEDGQVLEPGCGSGTFLGLAPAPLWSRGLIGVELDPTTAAIAAHLYPNADIRAESFADTRMREGSVDAVIGNVPFANVALHDAVHNPAGLAMHNHFIVKSLALTRPGGTVMVLTSRYTMDAQNPAARRAIAEQAVLLGALRLPNGAHQRTAGTDVITDLLVLRRRDGTETRPEPDWEHSAPVDLGAGTANVNQYFLDHPEHVLGALGYEAGRYGSGEVTVTATDDRWGKALGRGLQQITAHAVAADLGHQPRDLTDTESRVTARVGGRTDHFVGHLATTGGGFTVRRAAGNDEDLLVPRSQQPELRALLGLRDPVVAVLEAEAATVQDTPELRALRTTLAAAYTGYSTRFGPLNRVGQRRTGRVNPDTGAERMAQVRPPVMRLFTSDPFAATVRALEVYDAQTQTAVGAAILSQRVVAPRTPRLGADTPADAAAICLDTHAELRLGEVARLLGVDPATARQQLRGLAFDDPETGRLLPAAEYLSGNVRVRLAAATEASREAVAAGGEDPWVGNVAALTEVVPVDLEPGDIDARLGAAWIDATDVQAFLREVLADRSVLVVHTVGADWAVTGGRSGVLATDEWGTDRLPATQLAQSLLKQAPIRVSDEQEDGSRVFNPTATAAAQEKATLLGERFSEWVWEDPARAQRLSRTYNDTFNAIALRHYDTDHMSLPGLASSWTPRPHQLSAVARMVAEPNAGLFHEVGAGKTAEMAIGVMELRRLGLVRKPAIVVPNHMLDQFSGEFLHLYPQARVLAAGSDDLAGDKRRDFVARATTGQWDAVIMTRTAFTRLDVSPDTIRAYAAAEHGAHREALTRLLGTPEAGLTIKRLEKHLLAQQEKLKAKLDTITDPGVTFEQTGIDYLVVDELHDYKNLATPSNMRDAAIEGSDRAQDLHMKVSYLRNKHNGRAMTGATATPIANSITEAYVMQRYLRPDLLTAAGVHDFDTWAATFGSTVSEMEMSPDGGSWRMKTRFAKFRNVPEFLRIWHVAADVKTAEDLALPTPDLAVRADGQRAPETVVIAPSLAQAAFVTSLGERAEAVRNRTVEPTEDNMLKISSEGRAAALDLRLLPHVVAELAESTDPTLLEVDGPTKLETAADRIHTIWAANTTRVYTATNGAPHPRPGALQLVFSDLGTPRESWNAYDELRDLLTERGIPTEQVAFIHSARNDREKAQLFDAARTGAVQILLGSTAKMGVGTNVQARAVALHHLDCPWRPADLSQRDGRVIRQGNQNPEVQVIRYVTEATFDTYSWLLNRRAEGPLHRPGHEGAPGLPGDRGHRRRRPVLLRGQSPRVGRPAGAGKSRSR
jgi:N12 class adenine-specific DNA methylase